MKLEKTKDAVSRWNGGLKPKGGNPINQGPCMGKTCNIYRLCHFTFKGKARKVEYCDALF